MGAYVFFLVGELLLILGVVVFSGRLACFVFCAGFVDAAPAGLLSLP